MTQIAAGNRKMNDLAEDLIEPNAIGAETGEAEVLLCPPATLISGAAKHGTGIVIGGQDCDSITNGAHTGDISAQMLRDAGASHITLDLSKRRADHSDTDETVQVYCQTASGTDLTTILYVGEPFPNARHKTHWTLSVANWPDRRLMARFSAELR